MTSGKSTRVLDNHSTKTEQSYLTFDNKKWENTINSDGIALDTKMTYSTFMRNRLQFIFRTHKAYLMQKKSVKLVAKTAAPDGMIFDENGTLYFADLENKCIMYRKQDGSIHNLVEGEKSDG
jgi:hypothetical protein